MLLPFDYSVTDKRWFCQSRRDGRWTPISPETPIDICEYPPNRHLGMSSGSNCQNCHGSQIELVFDRQQRRFDTAFTSLSVNCESCHGPGRAHSDKKSKEPFDDLGAGQRRKCWGVFGVTPTRRQWPPGICLARTLTNTTAFSIFAPIGMLKLMYTDGSNPSVIRSPIFGLIAIEMVR